MTMIGEATHDCPFCQLDHTSDMLLDDEHWTVILDLNPVSPGHALLIPKRHVLSLFALSESEWMSFGRVLKDAKEKLDSTYAPAGYNIGVNQGEAAGQSIAHVHIHIIPRYKGDHAAPRGGIRGVIPERQGY